MPYVRTHLEVDSDVESFVCGLCGASLTVVDQGGRGNGSGTVYLKIPSNPVEFKVQGGTGKTAATELAIERLENELTEVQEAEGLFAATTPPPSANFFYCK